MASCEGSYWTWQTCTVHPFYGFILATNGLQEVFNETFQDAVPAVFLTYSLLLDACLDVNAPVRHCSISFSLFILMYGMTTYSLSRLMLIFLGQHVTMLT